MHRHSRSMPFTPRGRAGVAPVLNLTPLIDVLQPVHLPLLQSRLREVFALRQDKTLFVIGDGALRYSDIVAVIGHGRRRPAGGHRHGHDATHGRVRAVERRPPALRIQQARQQGGMETMPTHTVCNPVRCSWRLTRSTDWMNVRSAFSG